MLLRPGVWAGPLRAPEAPASAARSAPPAYSESVHVPAGCYISTTIYLARFRAEFPDEIGEPLSLVLPSFDGPHTVAVVTWQGGWWGRDEYVGVFDLRYPMAGNWDEETLREKAEYVLGPLAERRLKSGRISAGNSSGVLSDAERWKAVRTAESLLPCASQIYRVRCSQGDIPLLFFQPTGMTIAVYDPASGTATAEFAVRSIPRVVAMVAARLKYSVEAVWPDSLSGPSAQFAP